MAITASHRFMTEVPAYGGTLREGIIGLPRTINPILAVTDVDKDLSALVYSGLMKYDDGKLTTDIAVSYSVSEDGLVYDFKIKPDAIFQDGHPLTADDIEFTVQKIQDPVLKSPKRSDWANITVEKISEHDIRFTLKQAYAPFLNNTTVGILPKHIWGNVNNEQFIFSQYNVEPIGSGPYKVSAVVRDSGGIPTRYDMQTWRSYYEDKPFIDSLSFNFFKDEEEALVALDSSNIDSLSAVSPVSAHELANNSAQPYRVVSTSLPRVFGIFINQNSTGVLSDPNVRKALNMSVNRQALVDTVLYGYGTAIDGPLPPGMLSSASTSISTDHLQDLANAQAFLEKNKWQKNSDGIYEKINKDKSVTLLAFDIYTVDLPDLKQTAEMVKKDWTNLGASVNIKVFESGDLYQNVIRARKYDALLFGEQIGKDRDLYAFWHSSQRNPPGLNVSMYTNSKVDKILEDIRTDDDEASKTKDYSDLNEMIKQDIPAIFLYSPDFIYIVSKSLKGMVLENISVSSDRWNSIGKWYLNTEKVWNLLAK